MKTGEGKRFGWTVGWVGSVREAQPADIAERPGQMDVAGRKRRKM